MGDTGPRTSFKDGNQFFFSPLEVVLNYSALFFGCYLPQKSLLIFHARLRPFFFFFFFVDCEWECSGCVYLILDFNLEV